MNAKAKRENRTSVLDLFTMKPTFSTFAWHSA